MYDGLKKFDRCNFLEFLSLDVFNEILLNIWYERII